ncbi:hypothetical protein FZEAL_9095 [Fusarium zealandicum]|uniref:Cutinase n=1 Tax=Fusarium zealandicum TaxID=1053134 RepID=A0A8H4UD66_9HYPO|nr:hypothetical protein FZEAL_9095 [Fusarium zealandicum]
MHSLTTITYAALVAASAVSAQKPAVECYDGLKMFVSRGTGEKNSNYGATEYLVRGIKDQIDGSDYEAIEYPASDRDPSYFESVAQGVRLIKYAVGNYTKECPDSKVALFGYSQGAQITSNTVCGMPVIWALYGGFDHLKEQFNEVLELSRPMPEETFDNVVSVVLFGDPTHRDGAPYNHGNSTGSGLFWRDDISGCKALGSRMRSYCTAGDQFCAVGTEISVTAHGRYIQDYGKEVIEYVVSQYKNGGDSGSKSSDSSSSPTPMPEQLENAASRLVPRLVLLLGSFLRF